MSDRAEDGGAAGFGDLLAQAQKMQQQLLQAQAELATAEVEGQAGGGAVRVTATAGLDFRSVAIAPEAIDPSDVEMLQDLVLAAVRDAVAKANALHLETLGGLGGLGGLMPGPSGS